MKITTNRQHQMRDRDEYVEGDISVLKTWLFYICLYLIVLLWLEPVIDFLLKLNPPQPDPVAIDAFNERKSYVATVIFSFARSFPAMLFFWIGFQVMSTSRLPPKGLRMPFTVKVIKGQPARLYGMFIMGVAVFILFRELSGLMNI